MGDEEKKLDEVLEEKQVVYGHGPCLFLAMIILLVFALCWANEMTKKTSDENGVNNATKSLIRSANAPTYPTLWATLPTVAPDENNYLVAFDFAVANLAITKVHGEDTDLIVVLGCHGDDTLGLLKGRLRKGFPVKDEQRFSFRFTGIADQETKKVATFEDGILKIGDYPVELGENTIPVKVYNQDEKAVFEGYLYDSENCFPTIEM